KSCNHRRTPPPGWFDQREVIPPHYEQPLCRRLAESPLQELCSGHRKTSQRLQPARRPRARHPRSCVGPRLDALSGKSVEGLIANPFEPFHDEKRFSVGAIHNEITTKLALDSVRIHE